MGYTGGCNSVCVCGGGGYVGYSVGGVYSRDHIIPTVTFGVLLKSIPRLVTRS